MNQLNSIILEGNLVANAELTEPSKGFKVCRFSLGVNRFTKSLNGESIDEVSFFDVEAYGKLAEACEKNCTKGRGVRVVGRLKQNRWKNSEGKNFSKIYVIAEHVEYKPKFEKKDASEPNDSNEEKACNETNVQELEPVLEAVAVDNSTINEEAAMSEEAVF